MSWIREPNAEPIPGYRLIQPLGSGGFGEVWKCEAPGGLFKAIKFVYGNLNSLDVDCVRAEQELRALERIKEVRHPFVCSLDRIEVVSGELVIVMELAERTLHDRFLECQNAGMIGIPRDELLRYLADASEALDHMNEKHNLQHLDVKPRNLFLISERVKVADFGLVKHLERQSSSGLMGGVTPLYAAPETFLGKISPHSDQYSLAIVYMELLTGQRPFEGKNVRQLAQQHLREDPDLRALPEAERPILARALSKDPAKRFPNCMGLIHGLYKARGPARAPEPAPKGSSGHAASANGHANGKVKIETIRDIQLEEEEVRRHDSSAEVDLGAPVPEKGDCLSDLGMTIPQPETGALRPTLIVGIGAFGRRALLELRCRFLDRFGDLSQIPLLRFICLDPDPDAVNSAIRGAPEVALTRQEFFQLPLQPVGNYRRRNLEQMSEWLPREKLYAMSRSLQTQGSRALGRLAFADNQQRLVARLRKEIQEITNADTIYRSVSQTGLALRDMTPRVYVLAAAGGGSSGLLADLGFALRRLLAHLRHPDARVTSFLMAGATTDPATPKGELANVYATLTELNHYSDPSIAFAAQYGVDCQRIVDQGAPFNSVYLLPLAHRSPETLSETISHLGNYLFHELTTPLGLRLDNLRQTDDRYGSGPPDQMALPLRSIGTYAVWFPRGLLLRLAARFACRRLIEGWLDSTPNQFPPEIAAEIQRVSDETAANPELKPEALARAVTENTQAGSPTDLGNTPSEVLTGMLSKLEEQVAGSLAQEDPGNWARQALGKIRDWIGSGDDQQINEVRKTRLTRALATAAQKVAENWDKALSDRLLVLMELPGARVQAAEVALEHLQAFCRQTAESIESRIRQQSAQAAKCWNDVDHAVEDCVSNGGGGFRLFGRSKSRQLRHFLDQLSNFARQRLAEEVLLATRHCYGLLAGKLSERSRDLGFVRQRLRYLQDCLEHGPGETDQDMISARVNSDNTLSRSPIPSTESFWESIRQSNTARVVLPYQEEDLERAALHFLQHLHDEQWSSLDKELHERVLLPQGGLHKACLSSGDLMRQFAAPLLAEASVLLSQLLPIMDVAQILNDEIDKAGRPEDLKDQLLDYLDRAKPLITAKDDKGKEDFLLVPASPAGKRLGEMVTTAFPEVQQVRVAGQSDLMLCREQGNLTQHDLQAMLKPCRAAYEAAAGAPPSSPHARFDVSDWLPLDP